MSKHILEQLNPNEKIVYSNQFIHISEEPIEDKIFVRAYFEPSVHIIPISNNGNIWLIKEFRPGENKTRWLIPSGSLEQHETPEECAKKELEEELGQTSNNISLYEVAQYPKKSQNKKRYYFIAKNLKPVNVENPDGDVIIDKQAFTPQELKEKILNFELDYTPTLLILLKFIKDLETEKLKL